MRTLRLLRIAAEAEGLRLRRRAGRTVARAVMGLIALGFLAIGLVAAHFAGWFALRDGAGMATWAAALVVAGVDLLIALIFMLLAIMSRPRRIELEALQVRQRALDSAVRNLALADLMTPVLIAAIRAMRRDRGSPP